MMYDLSTIEKLAEYVKTCPEIVLYNLIDGMGCIAWQLNHNANRDASRGYICEADAKSMIDESSNLQAKIRVCVEQTIRFGIDPVFINPVLGYEVETASDVYWKWYRWWKDYVTSLTDAEFRQMDNDCEREMDLSKWRPQGDWRDAAK